jgi:hypothetical protein
MGHVTSTEHRETRSAYSIVVWKTKAKTSFGRPRRRWKDNIKIDNVAAEPPVSLVQKLICMYNTVL